MKEYVLGLYEKAVPKELSWPEKLTAAAEAGYDFLELSIDETEDRLQRLYMSAGERRKLRELAEDMGVPFRTMCLSGHRKFPLGSGDAATEARGMEIMEKALGLAEDLGIRIIQLAGYDVYYEDSTPATRQRFEENLKKAAKLAARHGVVMGFETMETELMNTVEKAMAYVNKVGSPYLQIYPDCGNITNAAHTYGTDVLADLRNGAGHLVAVHLKETVPGVFREVPFGTGHVNFREIIRTSWALGVRRFVTEFWYTGNPLWKEDLAQAIGMMRPLLSGECGKA